MSYSNISDILLEFNKDANSQKSALALSNTSEMEIKNLLKQIDTMIHHKKLRWERQKQELESKLTLKEQEFQQQKAFIDQKNAEIDQLKKIIKNMESNSQDIMNKYEHEIHSLNDELTKIKADYVKMQRKYKKQQQTKDSADAGTTSDEPPNGNKYRQTGPNTSSSSASSVASNSSRHHHFEVFSNKIVDSSVSGGSAVSSTLNSASAKRNQAPIFNPEVNGKQPVAVGNQLEAALNNKGEHQPHETLKMKQYETEVMRLNTQLDTHKVKLMELNHEKDKLSKLVHDYKKQNQELFKKVDELTKQENEAQTDKLNLDFYRQELRKRDEYIRNLEALEKASNIELQFYKDEVKKFKKQESAFKSEMDKLKNYYNEAMKRLEVIENENAKIKNKAQQNEEKARNEEMLNKKYEQEKERHCKEIMNLRNEINLFTTQLNERNGQIKSLNEKIKSLEGQLKEKDVELDKKNQELMMTNAHLEALKLENHFLRQSLDEKKSDEKEVLQMQKKYHHVLELTEKENKRLKNEVITLSDCVETLKSRNNFMSHPNMMNANNDIEQRRYNILREDYEKQMEVLKKQHELSIKRLNDEIEKLYSEKQVLMAELENKNHQQQHVYTNSHERLTYHHKSARSDSSSSNTESNSLSMGLLSSSSNGHAMNNLNEEPVLGFTHNSRKAKAVNHPIELTRHEENSFQRFRPNEQARNDPRLINKNLNFELDHSDSSSSSKPNRRMSLTSQLKMDEQKRKKDIENLLDHHIERLIRSNPVNEQLDNVI